MAGIYIHIPFCKRKCHYCNFFSIASLKRKDEFIDALLKEIKLQKNYLSGELVKTIYLGGGTPSMLEGDDIQRIYDEIDKHFTFSDNLEFTLEANPDDLSKEKLLQLRDTPINRFSIGVQSFNDQDLQYLNRVHNADQSKACVTDAQNAGFENLSVDLIYGIPGQTMSSWECNLQTLIEMNVPHISAYSLTVEPGTILENRISKNKILAPQDAMSIKHFEEFMRIMDANDYIHYEISNCCKEGFISVHNSNYWYGEKYLGLGPSAHSYNGIARQWNVSSISVYIEKIKNKIIPCEIETLSAKQRFNEYFMISLRTIQGCNLNYIAENFGEALYIHSVKLAKPYISSGHLILDNEVLFLTVKGKLFADQIAADMFIVD